MNDFICYPAIVEKQQEKGTYHINFPDLNDCNSTGKTISEAIKNAKEALGLYVIELEQTNKALNDPSEPKDINLKQGQQIIYIDLNMKLFKEKQETKSINRMVTLPTWLNALAKESDLNISSVLQEALKEKLGIEGK